MRVAAMKQTFTTNLQAKGPSGAWTYMPIPFDVEAAFGTKARVAVAGTINGFAFRNSLMPEGDGTHSMMVNKDLQAGAKARAGDTVAVTMEKDEKERSIATPDDFAKALAKNKKAASTFAVLTHAQKKEFIDWISSAKQQATRDARITKATKMLAEGCKRVR
jgi:Uncharacterized protein conserved in bacteria